MADEPRFDPASLTVVAITDDLRDGRDGLVARAAAAARGGATMIHLRLKDEDASVLVDVARALVQALPVPVVVSERADIALAAGAAGVHLGAEGVPATAIRRLAPGGFIIGASVGSEDDVASAAGADYVGIGPVFATSSRSEAGAIGLSGLDRLRRLAALPAVAIGGVTPDNAADALWSGASGIAVIRAIFGAPDPERAARALRSATGR